MQLYLIYATKFWGKINVSISGQIDIRLNLHWRTLKAWAQDNVVYLFPDNKGTLSPRIHPSNEVTIVGQRQVNVTCEVSIESGLYERLTSDFYPNFEMHYPAQKVRILNGQFTISTRCEF